jgi:hypothetical protein
MAPLMPASLPPTATTWVTGLILAAPDRRARHPHVQQHVQQPQSPEPTSTERPALNVNSPFLAHETRR